MSFLLRPARWSLAVVLLLINTAATNVFKPCLALLDILTLLFRVGAMSYDTVVLLVANIPPQFNFPLPIALQPP